MEANAVGLPSPTETPTALFPVRGVPGMLYRCLNDSDWTMLWVSEGCRALTGYDPEELVDNRTVSYSEVIRPEDRLAVSLEVQTALAERRPFQLRYHIRRANGQLVPVWEQGYGVYSEQGSVLLIEGVIVTGAEPAATGRPSGR
jgi:PAS domain S-box-containing protein